MKLNFSIKYAIAFCCIALISSNAWAQNAPGELIFNGDFNRMNTGQPFLQVGTPFTNFAALPWIQNGNIGLPRIATDIEIGMPNFTDPNIRQRTDLAGFESSPAGGSFVGMDATATLYQDVRFFDVSSQDDSDVPESITITFYYTEYNRNINTPGNPSPSVDLEITLNEFSFSYDGLIYEVPNLNSTGGTPGTWETRSVTFSPADFGITDGKRSYRLTFATRGTNVDDYVFIDGISMKATGTADDICDPNAAPPILIQN